MNMNQTPPNICIVVNRLKTCDCDQSQNSKLLKEASVLSKKFLTCTNPICNKPGPTKICSNCKLAYYCSKECQSAHWKGIEDGPVVHSHKQSCKAVNVKSISNIFNRLKCAVQGYEHLPLKGPCIVCEEKRPVDPVKMQGCDHVMCWNCIDYWTDLKGKGYEDDDWHWKYHCPCNRKHDTDIRGYFMRKSEAYKLYAMSYPLCIHEKEAFLRNAARDIMKITNVRKFDRMANYQLAVLMKLLGKNEQALETLNNLDTRIYGDGSDTIQYPSVKDEDEDEPWTLVRYDLIFLRAEIFVKLGKFREGLSIYNHLEFILSKPSLSPFNERLKNYVNTGIPGGKLECKYHLGLHQEVINDYERYIKQNKKDMMWNFQALHKWKAKSQRILGDLDGAIVTLHRAVVIPSEQPNNMVARIENMKILKIFLAEQTVQKTPKKVPITICDTSTKHCLCIDSPLCKNSTLDTFQSLSFDSDDENDCQPMKGLSWTDECKRAYFKRLTAFLKNSKDLIDGEYEEEEKIEEAIDVSHLEWLRKEIIELE